jgi:hypothetical protein
MEQREQRHDESRGAEAALRAMKVDQRLLNRMQAAVTRKILDSDEVRAVGLASQHDAGVDGAIDEATANMATEHDRAGPTIPLGAAFFGSGRAFMQTKIIQKRKVRCDAAQMNDGAATQELDMATHARLIPLRLTFQISK